MPFVLIRHKVANYAKWKHAVQAVKTFRKTSGEKSLYVVRSSNEPNDVTVFCAWDTAARMRKFVKSADLRKAMNEAGVVSKPEVQFFSKMEDLSVG
jgi:heme-degrading monooxygenase HmoA